MSLLDKYEHLKRQEDLARRALRNSGPDSTKGVKRWNGRPLSKQAPDPDITPNGDHPTGFGEMKQHPENPDMWRLRDAPEQRRVGPENYQPGTVKFRDDNIDLTITPKDSDHGE